MSGAAPGEVVALVAFARTDDTIRVAYHPVLGEDPEFGLLLCASIARSLATASSLGVEAFLERLTGKALDGAIQHLPDVQPPKVS